MVFMNLVTKADFARLIGVSRAAAHKTLTTKLAEGLVNGRADLDHPVIAAYLQKKEISVDSAPVEVKKTPPRVTKPRKNAKKTQEVEPTELQPEAPAKTVAQPVQLAGYAARAKNRSEASKVDDSKRGYLPDNIMAYEDWTLRAVVDEFGNSLAFNDYLKATKSMCDIQEKRLKNEEKAGVLVNRDLVKVAFIDPVNTAHERLLGDSKKTIARRMLSAFQAGEDIAALERIVAKEITAHIRPLKAAMKKALRDV